jgi:hypothetical protein
LKEINHVFKNIGFNTNEWNKIPINGQIPWEFIRVVEEEEENE